MGINYYGKCNGTSGGKYNLWLSVSENSYSVSSNVSNVTVKLCLKRNDGYSASAYNLTEDANTVRLTVGGEVKVNKSLAIDTRNCVTVTLAQWRGNVSHNSDGTLNLSIGGQFTMSSTNLSGGSAQCTFKCTTIPRASGLTLSASGVIPGGTLKATVTAASDTFTHRLVWSLGGKSAFADLGAGVKEQSISIPADWAGQVTKAKTDSLKITLKTLSNGVVIGSVDKNITFTIPDNSSFKPDFTVALERIDNRVPPEFGVYVKGVSQVRVKITDIDLKYGATESSLVATVCGVSKQGISTVFDLSRSGEVTVGVKLTDSRGLVAEKTQSIRVYDYRSPTVEIQGVERCNADGTPNPRGTCLVASFKESYSDVNSLNRSHIILKYKGSGATAFGDPMDASSPFVFGDSTIEEGSSYLVAVGIKDSICEDYITFEYPVSVADIPFNIRPGGRGAAFGRFATNDNELAVAWNMSVEGDLAVNGGLNYREVSCETTENARNLTCTARLFPALKMVWLGLRLQTTKELSANVSHTVAIASDAVPGIFTPLQAIADYPSGGQATGGILNTGEVIVRSDTAIASGKYIYLSGIYTIRGD